MDKKTKKLISWSKEAQEALEKIKKRRMGVCDSYLLRELVIKENAKEEEEEMIK